MNATITSKTEYKMLLTKLWTIICKINPLANLCKAKVNNFKKQFFAPKFNLEIKILKSFTTKLTA